MNVAKVLLAISALAVLIYAASPKAKLNSNPPVTQTAVVATSSSAAPVSVRQEKEDDDDGAEEAREMAGSRVDGKAHKLVAGRKASTEEAEDDDDDASEIVSAKSVKSK